MDVTSDDVAATTNQPGPSSPPLDFVDLTNVQVVEVNSLAPDYSDDEVDANEVDIFKPINLPHNLFSLLVLKDSLITCLRDFRRTLVNRLDRNRERQADLVSGELTGGAVTWKEKEVHVSADAAGPSHPNALAVFRAPYFKDVRGFHPPANPDVVQRREKGLLNQALIDVAKPFVRSELDQLQSLVRQFGLRKLLQPLVRQKESLITEIEIMESCCEPGSADEEKIEMKRASIRSLDREIAELSTGYQMPSLEESISLDWMSIAVRLDSCHTDTECMLKWINEQHPHINRSPFTPQETEKIKQLVPSSKNDYDAVAAALSSPGKVRRAWQVATHYQSSLNSDIKKTGPLSKAEALLLEVVISHCRIGDFIPWPQVNSFVPGRTLPQLKHFWSKKNSTKVGDPWTELEDQVLAVAVQKFGIPQWNRVAHYVFGRTNRQCRERYALRLAISDRKIGSWTKEEDMAIIDAAEKHDFKWAVVQNEIPHRNCRQIAQRYALLMENMKKNTGSWTATTAHPESRNTAKMRAFRAIQKLKASLDSEEKMIKFLNQSREKLKQAHEHRHDPLPCEQSSRDAFPSSDAAAVDQQISEIFAFYSASSAPKTLNRGSQDQQVYLSARDSLKDLLLGRKLQSTNPFNSVIERIFTTEVTSSLGDGTPAVLPPNRTTLRALQGLLLQRDYLVKKLDDAGIATSQIKQMAPKTPEYDKLSQIFKAIFYWPAICSITDAPAAPEERVRLTKTPQEAKQWKKERAAVLSRERDKQAVLLRSASGTGELAEMFDQMKQSPDSTAHIEEFKRVAYLQEKTKHNDEATSKPVNKKLVKKAASERGKKRSATVAAIPSEPERRSKRTPKPRQQAE